MRSWFLLALTSALFCVSCAQRKTPATPQPLQVVGDLSCEQTINVSGLPLKADGHTFDQPISHIYMVTMDDGVHEVRCPMVNGCTPASSEEGGDETCVDQTQCCDLGAHTPKDPTKILPL